MFDRLIFDSGKFDRENNNKYEGNIHGIGEINTSDFVFAYIFSEFTFSGESTFFAMPGIFSNVEGSVGDIIEGNPGGQNGSGGLNLVLVMEYTGTFSAVGYLDVDTFGDIETSILNLRGISLLPGETITIDTDTMIVLFGLTHDVSSLTTDSKFFYLNEGDNEISFAVEYETPPSPGPDNELETTIIWQNRWL